MSKTNEAAPTVWKALNEEVSHVINDKVLLGFEKSFQLATAIGRLKDLLTTEYMTPIMSLQGNKLGFKTDKDSGNGYTQDVVKNCLIEAVLTGVQPFGNQFNIIAGNCYITKEGFGYLLKNYEGLSYDITPSLPRINQDKTSAAIDMTISWTIEGKSKTKVLPVPVKMNQFMGTDAVIGKATRKARAWLYNTITGSEVSDGDITEDASFEVIKDTTVDFEELQALYNVKENSLTEDEKLHAERILNNKEVNSYQKLLKILQSK